MKKLLKLIILNFTLLLFLHIPSHSIEITKDLKLLDLSKVNDESCRYAGRGALTLNKNFSDFIQGYEEPLAIDGASTFLKLFDIERSTNLFLNIPSSFSEL